MYPLFRTLLYKKNLKKFYSHDNYLYGIDPHTGSHDISIVGNTVYNNNASGIICSKYCYNLLTEGNRVYNNTGVGRGIAFSINTTNSIARDNHVYDQTQTTNVNYVPLDSNYYQNILSNMAKNNYFLETINVTNIKIQSIKNATSIQQVDQDNKSLLVENFLE